MRYFHRLTLITLIITLLCGCKGYNNLLRGTDFEAKYNTAVEYFNKGKYTKASQLFENLQLYYRGQEHSEDIAWYYAQTLDKMHDNYNAAYQYATFARRYPYSERAEEALYMSAVCKYKQAPEYSLDQTVTNSAITDLEYFAEHYPSSVHIPEVNNMLDNLQARLMKKDYENAVIYYTTEHWNAAQVALNNFLNQYPESPYREEAMYYILRADYEYAINSREDKMKERLQTVINDFDRFSMQFSQSKHMASAQDIYAKSRAMLTSIEQAAKSK